MAIQVWHIMREKVSITKDTTAKQAAHKMISSGLPGLPVVNEAMEVIGVVTEHGILGAMQEGMDLEKTTTAQIMSESPLTVESSASPDDLTGMMINNHPCAVIAVVKNNKCVGVVSRQMLMEAHVSPCFSFSTDQRKGHLVCA